MAMAGEVVHMLLHRDNGQFYYLDDRNIHKSAMRHVNARFLGKGKGFEFVSDWAGEVVLKGEPDWNALSKGPLITEAKKKFPDLKLDKREPTSKLRAKVIEHAQKVYEDTFIETGEVPKEDE